MMRQNRNIYVSILFIATTLYAKQNPFDLQNNVQKIERDQQMILDALKTGTASHTQKERKIVRKVSQDNRKVSQKQERKNKDKDIATAAAAPTRKAPSLKKTKRQETPQAADNTAPKSVKPPQKTKSIPKRKKTRNISQSDAINAAVSKLNDLLKEDRVQYAQKIAEKSDKKPKSKTKLTVQQKDEAQADLKKALHEAIRAVDKE